MKEKLALRLPGALMLVVWLGLLALATGSAVSQSFAVSGVATVLLALVSSGFVIVQPNHSRVVTFLGNYLGTIRKSGWSWTYPLTMREKVSLRIHNFDSEVLKVNDAAGNPVEISAVIVWQIIDTAKAAFEVEDYQNFVRVQTETAVRHVASEYPYDNYGEEQPSLRADADTVTEVMQRELQDQLKGAGIKVIRTQLRRLAYAPEIAADMLRRQQAEAVVAARTRIVEGAVGMVQHALESLKMKSIVEFDEERKAAMVSNLLVVLCSEHHAQPVVNAGSLFT